MKKLTFLFIIIICSIVGVSLGTHYTSGTQSPTVLPTPTAIPVVAAPVTLDIPRMHIHASVESVGLDSEQRMDVPHNPVNVAWYKLGAKPGEIGNAVIDGHVDLPTGAPSVFWDLKKVRMGDELDVTDQNGRKYTFIVDKIANFPTDTFPIDTVFGKTSDTRLNLITRTGTWDRTKSTYDQRLVVFSKRAGE